MAAKRLAKVTSACVLSALVAACGERSEAEPVPPPFRQRMTTDEERFERERTLPLEPAGVPLPIGAHAPNFDGLPPSGKRVVVFYRGEWCPYCLRQLGELEDALPDLRAAGATLVAVGSDVPAKRDALVRKLRLTYPVISDPELVVTNEWGVRQHNVHAPLPATFVLDTNGDIVWRHVSRNPVDRATVAEILGALRGG
jgi:peroxiredoxin